MKIEIGSLVIVTKDTYSSNIGRSGILKDFNRGESKFPYYVEFYDGTVDIVKDVAPATELMKALI